LFRYNCLIPIIVLIRVNKKFPVLQGLKQYLLFTTIWVTKLYFMLLWGFVNYWKLIAIGNHLLLRFKHESNAVFLNRLVATHSGIVRAYHKYVKYFMGDFVSYSTLRVSNYQRLRYTGNNVWIRSIFRIPYLVLVSVSFLSLQ